MGSSVALGSILRLRRVCLTVIFQCSLPVQLYRPVEETPCHFVSSLDELVELNEKLLGCREFAVDLEVPSSRPLVTS